MPLTMAAFGVASLSMAGIPLLAGFVSKWYLLLGGVDAGQPLVLVVLVASGALNVAYFWPIVYAAFFETPADADPKPVMEHPMGGRAAGAARTDGGRSSSGGDGNTADSHGSTSEEGDSDAGWERRSWRGEEASYLLLVPLVLTATLTVAFGVLVDHLFFLDAVVRIVEGATGVGVP
jgi:multicomponent Na+:H+ antiporter subunit D